MSITDIDLTEEESITNEVMLKQDIDGLVIKMEAAKITTDEEFTGAAEWLKLNKKYQKQVKDYFEDERKATYEAYSEITSKIKDMTDLLKKGEAIVKGKLSDYQKELDRKQRIADEKARKEQ